MGRQLRLQSLDRRAQADQWSLVTVQALAQVAEHRLGLDGEREDLRQRQLGVEPDDLIAPGVQCADQRYIAGRGHGPAG